MNYAICIPTYNKKDLKCLKLLDGSVDINFFVRQEQLDEGFYDFLDDVPNVSVVSLGDNVIDIGDTRERVMKWCRDHDVMYCVMLDDGVDELYIDGVPYDVHTTITRLIADYEQMRIIHPHLMGAAFRKRKAIFADGSKRQIDFGLDNRHFLACTPTQAVMWDVQMCQVYDLHYKTLDVCGFEDCAFYVDALKEGLLVYTPNNYCFSAVVPNTTKLGGNHKPDENIERKYDKQSFKCREYLGDIYGIGLSKRYRNYANAFLTLVEVDNDFFNEVLVLHRKANQKIIDTNFKIDC